MARSSPRDERDVVLLIFAKDNFIWSVESQGGIGEGYGVESGGEQVSRVGEEVFVCWLYGLLILDAHEL